MLPHREFFARDALDVAPELLGARLTVTTSEGSVTVRITETEAYHGLGTGDVHDGGSHARNGMTARNASMFGEPGHLYVYFSYGMHNAVNVVCSPRGVASGVLLRAGEVVAGEDLARSRRAAARSSRDLARGPGRLAQALALRYTEHDGIDALGGPEAAGEPEVPRDLEALSEPDALDAHATSDARGSTRARLELPETPPVHISRGPRTGVSGEAGTAAFPWRFWITDDPTVSPYRPATVKKRTKTTARGDASA